MQIVLLKHGFLNETTYTVLVNLNSLLAENTSGAENFSFTVSIVKLSTSATLDGMNYDSASNTYTILGKNRIK